MIDIDWAKVHQDGCRGYGDYYTIYSQGPIDRAGYAFAVIGEKRQGQNSYQFTRVQKSVTYGVAHL